MPLFRKTQLKCTKTRVLEKARFVKRTPEQSLFSDEKVAMSRKSARLGKSTAITKMK